MFENPYWKAMTALIGGTAILGILAYSRNWIAPDDWVGWIQAVGSVAAIIASVFIAQGQHWQENASHDLETEQRRKGLLILIFPELTDLKCWSETSRQRLKVILESTDQNIRVLRVDIIPQMPEMMDRFVDQLVLLGDETATDIVESLALVRSLHRTGEEFFRERLYMEGPRDDPKLQTMLAGQQRRIQKLDQDLWEVLLVIARQHPLSQPQKNVATVEPIPN